MSYLDTLTPEQITRGPLPLKDLLHNSLYYPSSGFDGGVIKDCNTLARNLNIVSFIYCDYAMGEATFKRYQDDFAGYHILATRSLTPRELTPNGWQPQPPPRTDPQRYTRFRDKWQPFAHWTVYERDAHREETHGPKRFSLIYIGGEGVATYQAIYWSNRAAPRALAIIQPGTGFGLNWTDFTKKDGHLAWVVGQNPYGQPDTIYYGGIGDDYSDFDWDHFVEIRCIRPYYGIHGGETRVWQKR